MDAVSRLVRLARLEGGLDVRCLLAGRFAIDHDAVGPGQVPFHLVLEGRCTLTAGGSTVHMEPGDLVLLPHGTAHRVSASTGRRRRLVEEPGGAFPTRRTVGAEPELDLLCGHYGVESGAGALLFRLLPPLVHVSLDASALAVADLLRAEAQFDGEGTGVIVTALCDALLAMALRSRPGQRLSTPALWTAMGDDTLGRVVAEIVARPGEAWTIERLAESAAMSRATFVRHFTARTGTTVATLVTAIRMMVAADLLTRSDLSVGRVAGTVGYRSESAFTQAFRAALGTSPARYRRGRASGGG
ncbi:AraC family transcriptional regulator [Kutzneria sp. 744]|uniref:cupin domain-containing protein n=1 Tax=Kutzneria sp. (strain 744) TaxID=345341 RepID=UPI0003EEC205|nr:AraC family transcriptional regulator [Kutzneria sp. 744]EWM18689.1 transcriptional regulator, AraC family [Kutzneria sp. 744]